MKKLHASGEDYLEAVLVLQKGKRLAQDGRQPWRNIWPGTLAGSSRRNRSTRLYGTSFRRAAART